MVLFYSGINPVIKNWCCYAHPINILSDTLRWHYIWISCSYRLLNKNEGIGFYIIQRACELYTEIHGSISVNSCQIALPLKIFILLSNVSIIVYKAGKHTGVENKKFIHFNLSPGTYSIDDFNAKIRAVVPQQSETGNHLKLNT